MITFDELKTLKKEELIDEINKLSNQYVKKKFAQQVEGKSNKPHLIKETRKRIAQAKTLLRQKEREVLYAQA